MKKTTETIEAVGEADTTPIDVASADTLRDELEALAAEYKKKLAALDLRLVSAAEAEKPLGAPKDLSAGSLDETVEVRLFCDGDRYKDDVLVGINGYMCRIRRGECVRLRRAFADILAEAEADSAEVCTKLKQSDGVMKKFA